MKHFSLMPLAWCVRRFEEGKPVAVWWRHIKDLNPSPDRKPIGVAIDHHIPQATFTACIGKPIHDVIDHPLLKEHFGPDDTIKDGMMSNRGPYGPTDPITVFEIRRKRKS